MAALAAMKPKTVAMRRTLMLLLLLSACTDPRLNAAVSLGPDGVSLRPSLSGRVGGVGVAISP